MEWFEEVSDGYSDSTEELKRWLRSVLMVMKVLEEIEWLLEEYMRNVLRLRTSL